MEDLLCDEVWLSSPKTQHFHEPGECVWDEDAGSFYVTKEDFEQALRICLEKELGYMPEPQYVEYLHSNGLVFARFKAVLWFIKSRARLNFAIGTVFNAVNYLDRFISMSHCQRWKHWMIELLSVACLSVASKFNETSSLPSREMQMEGLVHLFRSSTIQRMELALMDALQWRLNCTTTYSYIELMVSNVNCVKHHHKELTNQPTKMLLTAQLDSKLLVYPPSVIAASAVQEVMLSSCHAHLADVSSFLNQLHQKDDVVECHKIMQTWSADPFFNTLINASEDDDDEYSCFCPSSPVTVLFKEPINVDDCQVDLSLFRMPAASGLIHLESCGKKRKREEEQ